jgi:hypothetical protein
LFFLLITYARALILWCLCIYRTSCFYINLALCRYDDEAQIYDTNVAYKVKEALSTEILNVSSVCQFHVFVGPQLFCFLDKFKFKFYNKLAGTFFRNKHKK